MIQVWLTGRHRDNRQSQWREASGHNFGRWSQSVDIVVGARPDLLRGAKFMPAVIVGTVPFAAAASLELEGLRQCHARPDLSLGEIHSSAPYFSDGPFLAR